MVIKANYVSLVPIGRLLAFDHRSGLSVLKKLKILRMNQSHRSVALTAQRFDPPPLAPVQLAAGTAPRTEILIRDARRQPTCQPCQPNFFSPALANSRGANYPR